MSDDWDDDLVDDTWKVDDDDDTTMVVSCPSCGENVYEDAEQCPNCGDYIVPGTSAWAGKPMWWILLGLLGVIAVLTAFTFG